jgi:hypothetical protein
VSTTPAADAHPEYPANAETAATLATSRDPFVAIVVVLWLIALISTGRRLAEGQAVPRPPPAPIIASVDPNTAPWWELSVLPGIGEATARRIVSYREAQAIRDPQHGDGRVFRRPADLDRVHGIGPAKIERLAADLRFDS